MSGTRRPHRPSRRRGWSRRPSPRRRSPRPTRPRRSRPSPSRRAAPPMRRRPSPNPRPRRNRPRRAPRGGGRLAALGLGWIGLIAAVLIVGVVGGDLPPADRNLVAAIGLALCAAGTHRERARHRHRDINYRNEMEDGQVVLMVTGKLVNITRARAAGAADPRDLVERRQPRTLPLEFLGLRRHAQARPEHGFPDEIVEPAGRCAASRSPFRRGQWLGGLRTASRAGRYNRVLPSTGRARRRACAVPPESRARAPDRICRAP